MPSPFPGMDPYLEGSLWMTVHTQLSVEIARQLAPKLRPKYVALTTERFVLEESEDIAIATTGLYPDVAVTTVGSRTATDTPITTASPPLRMATLIASPVPHVTVEIRDTANRQLVTVIEVLSPTNKRGDGRNEYLVKRRRILLSTAHLLEVDLLRDGRRIPMKEPLPGAPYFVFLSRAESRPITDIWPIQLADRLPTVPVPLLPGDVDVPLDLQLALQTVYDAVGYDLAVDYRRAPEHPLGPPDAAWAEGLLG